MAVPDVEESVVGGDSNCVQERVSELCDLCCDALSSLQPSGCSLSEDRREVSLYRVSKLRKIERQKNLSENESKTQSSYYTMNSAKNSIL